MDMSNTIQTVINLWRSYTTKTRRLFFRLYGLAFHLGQYYGIILSYTVKISHSNSYDRIPID